MRGCAADAKSAALATSRGAWQLLGAALLAQTSVSLVEQGLPTLGVFIQDDLGDMRTFSLDSPESHKPRLAALRKL